MSEEPRASISLRFNTPDSVALDGLGTGLMAGSGSWALG